MSHATAMPHAPQGQHTRPDSLALVLRERTAEAHTRAERHPQQGRLVKGLCTKSDYAAWLGQMLPIWNALDEGLATRASRDPRVRAMLRDYHPHAGRIRDDLRHLGEQEPAPLPATRNFESLVRSLAAGPGIVGVWYVLEGSSNGGRYIARAVSRALHLPGPDGLRGLDPHGEAQHERWGRWKADLDSQFWSDADQDAIVRAAVQTFDHVFDVLSDIEAARPVSAS
jgi:heme oxygenase